ncbi:hypothetical protein LXL04_035162 [Taraxacum kok-saghyz]
MYEYKRETKGKMLPREPDGREDKDEGWKTVRSRRPHHSGSDEVTSFFVNNIPIDTTRSELWKPCSRFGQLVDIYIPRRRDAGGSYFAFVKYKRINSIEETIEKLNSVSFGGQLMKANISKHPRKPAPAATPKVAPPTTRPQPIHHNSSRGHRSYADVTNGHTPQMTPPRLTLKIIE